MRKRRSVRPGPMNRIVIKDAVRRLHLIRRFCEEVEQEAVIASIELFYQRALQRRRNR